MYPDDLTDNEWKLMETIIEETKTNPRGCKGIHSKRSHLNAIFYILRTGCSWRHLPQSYPPWKSVYSQFLRWRDSGIIEKIHLYVRQGVRAISSRNQSASAAIVDSQSTRTTEKRGPVGDLMEEKR